MLTTAEAARRLAADGPNEITPPPARGRLRVVVDQLRDPMILLLLGAAVLTIALRDAVDTTVILLVVVVNTAVGAVQEQRAARAVAALQRMAAPTATVVRDGRAARVPARDLVVGDQVRLEAGDVVPADLDLVEAARLQVDESAVTGESVPVDRSAAEDERALLGGTVVTRGRGVAVVVRTGDSSNLGRIAALVGEERPRPTPLQRRLSQLSRVLAFAALGISSVVAALGLLQGQPAGRMAVTAVSLAVAAVPESLPAVVTIALALGARRMAQRHALVRRLPAVETLGSVSVLATDKTGTLTENRMVVQHLRAGRGRYAVQGTGYTPDGALLPLDEPDDDAVARLARDVVLCNDAELVPPDADDPDWRAVGDPMEAALLALAAKSGAEPAGLRATWTRVAEAPFDSVRQRMTTAHHGATGTVTVCKGAPEVVLALAGLRVDRGLAEVRAEAAALADKGFRVLAVADREGCADLPPLSEDALQLVGLVAISDPPRAAAADVVERVQDAGLRLVLITGDHPATAGAVARGVGLPAEPVVTGDELANGLPASALAETAVFARTRPEQKLEIVRSLQTDGFVVAMTGDGVNDAPALRAADIGVAMGRGGTEVARQAADLVLTDDDLGTVVAAVEEGRRIYTNIRRFLRYAVSGGLAEVLVMLVAPLFGLAVPLLPAQILWVNLLTHGLPGVAMGAEPADPRAMRQRPRHPDEFVLGDGLLRRIAWTGALIAAVTLAGGLWAHGAGVPVRTEVFLVLGLAQIGVALALRQGGYGARPRALDVAVLGALVLQLAAVWFVPLRDLLGTVEPGEHAVLVGAALAVVPGLVTAVTVRRARP